MAYSTGMMDMRVTVAKKTTETDAGFGKNGQPKYWILGTYWASEKFDKGMKSLREGALDSYKTVMFRMRYHKQIDEWCLVKYEGKWYQITSFNASYRNNEIQITAVCMPNQKVTIVDPSTTPTTEVTGTEQTGTNENENQNA